jgi:putative DNA primase/helicase
MAITITDIAAAFNRKVQRSSRGAYLKVPGPNHSEEDDSLTITVATKGGGDDDFPFIVHSHAGDDDLVCKDYVRERCGLPKWKPNGKKKANGGSDKPWTFVAEYLYRTAEGKPHLLVKKYLVGGDPKNKQYPQEHWDGSQFVKGKHPGARIPYKLPQLLAAQVSVPVHLCEGEKDVESLTKIGFLATTASGGAKAPWDPAMTDHFAGRTVVILPHSDAVGREHGRKVAKALFHVAKNIKIVDLFPDRDNGDDVSVFLEHDKAGVQLAKRIKEASDWSPVDEKTQDDAALAELVALQGIEYARRKQELSKELGIAQRDLDKAVEDKREQAGATTQMPHWAVEPWMEAVPTGKLLDELDDFFGKHIVLSGHGIAAMSLWVLHAWSIDAAWASPFLMFVSPVKRCGKSTALTLLHRTGPRTVMASNISPTAIFRFIQSAKPTLLIDEADTHSQSEEARGIYNSGHTRDTASVVRNVGDRHEPQPFSTWGPKAIAGIGKFAETMRDRAIILKMKRKLKTQTVSKLKGRDTEATATLRRKCCRWAADNVEALKKAEPAMPKGLDDRAEDHWEALLAIADLAGGEWPAKARAAAVALSGEDIDDASLGTQLLAAIKHVMEAMDTDRMASAVLVDHLAKIEDGPWAAYGKLQKPITQRQVSSLLSDFEIYPDSIRLAEGGTKKGYLLKWFESAFEAYLDISPSRSGTPEQANNDGPNLHFRSGTAGGPVPDEKCEKPNNDGLCSVVPDRRGENGQFSENCDHCGHPAKAGDGLLDCAIGGVSARLHRDCIDRFEASVTKQGETK